MVTGTVLRRHAGGYLVHADGLNVSLQCPIRARLKKEGVTIFTGDRVELDEIDLGESDGDRGSAVIAARIDRRNLLTRPPIANVEQVFIVQSTRQPDWNGLLCDRYLVHFQLELDTARPFICVNKCDLASNEEILALRNIYEPLGYAVLFVSAKTGQGIDELQKQLQDRVSVMTGPSGVGKSSLINRLNPTLNLKVDVNEELLVGRHTTTYSELYRLPNETEQYSAGWIADTPGFSVGELKHPQPAEVAWQFPEIMRYSEDCKYANCLHLVEQGCMVIANLDQIAAQRYLSYSAMVGESIAEAKLQRDTSQKVDTGVVKFVGGARQGRARAVPKLSTRYRTTSRRKARQELDSFDEDEEGGDDTAENDVVPEDN